MCEEALCSEEVGRGKFDTMFCCFHPISNQFYACKVIHKTLLTDSIDCQCRENESKFITYLSPRPNILQTFDAFKDADLDASI
ncbi:Protein kinase-like domain superfamily [Sesbania bispinosa]|nr:Protein kinase-like domain superfamily [Sesbania bispinosa]